MSIVFEETFPGIKLTLLKVSASGSLEVEGALPFDKENVSSNYADLVDFYLFSKGELFSPLEVDEEENDSIESSTYSLPDLISQVSKCATVTTSVAIDPSQTSAESFTSTPKDMNVNHGNSTIPNGESTPLTFSLVSAQFQSQTLQKLSTPDLTEKGDDTKKQEGESVVKRQDITSPLKADVPSKTIVAAVSVSSPKKVLDITSAISHAPAITSLIGQKRPISPLTIRVSNQQAPFTTAITTSESRVLSSVKTSVNTHSAVPAHKLIAHNSAQEENVPFYRAASDGIDYSSLQQTKHEKNQKQQRSGSLSSKYNSQLNPSSLFSDSSDNTTLNSKSIGTSVISRLVVNPSLVNSPSSSSSPPPSSSSSSSSPSSSSSSSNTRPPTPTSERNLPKSTSRHVNSRPLIGPTLSSSTPLTIPQSVVGGATANASNTSARAKKSEPSLTTSAPDWTTAAIEKTAAPESVTAPEKAAGPSAVAAPEKTTATPESTSVAHSSTTRSHENRKNNEKVLFLENASPDKSECHHDLDQELHQLLRRVVNLEQQISSVVDIANQKLLQQQLKDERLEQEIKQRFHELQEQRQSDRNHLETLLFEQASHAHWNLKNHESASSQMFHQMQQQMQIQLQIQVQVQAQFLQQTTQQQLQEMQSRHQYQLQQMQQVIDHHRQQLQTFLMSCLRQFDT